METLDFPQCYDPVGLCQSLQFFKEPVFFYATLGLALENCHGQNFNVIYKSE